MGLSSGQAMEGEGKIFSSLYPKRAFDGSPVTSCDNLLFSVLILFIKPKDRVSRYC